MNNVCVQHTLALFPLLMRRFSLLAIATFSASMFLSPALAMQFPDVPASHPFYGAIHALAGKGVIKGHPDGTFKPMDPVNRAQMLTMLYRAGNMPYAAATAGCYPDVPLGQWFTDIVCDAHAAGYAGGYLDGTFGPQRPVSRAEGLKMVFTVLDLTDYPLQSIPYSDVAPGDWYAEYVSSALQAGILPVGEMTSRFEPHRPMYRAEAAQLIWNALLFAGLIEPLPASASPASSSSSAMSRASSIAVSSSTVSRKSVSGDDATSDDTMRSANVIFDEEFALPKSGVSSLKFDIATKKLYLFRASMKEGATVPDCRLYKLEKDGLSFEYYLGLQTGTECWIRVALAPGSYQLDLMGQYGDIVHSWSIEPQNGGDGNDGFSEAKAIARASNYAMDLAEDDAADWFQFSVARQTQMELAVTSNSSSTLQCVIYPLKDVTMQGFDFPSCNMLFLYEKGAYVVGVMHSKSALKAGQQRKETYTLRLK